MTLYLPCLFLVFQLSFSNDVLAQEPRFSMAQAPNPSEAQAPNPSGAQAPNPSEAQEPDPSVVQEPGHLMSVERVFSYAKALEKERDFNRAATEYGRLVFFLRHHPEASFKQKEEVFYRHALALANAGATDEALRAFSVLGASFPTSRYISPALLRMGQIYEKAGLVEEAKRRYQTLLGRDQRFAIPVRLRLAWLALQKDTGVTEARDHLRKTEDAAPVERGSAMHHTLDRLVDRPRKNPQLAGILTALLPGSGHWYLERPQDGLFAFLSNGLLLAGSVQAFQRDISGLGVVLGVIELGWYTGTIFSAVSLTHRFNRRIRAERLEEIRPFLQLDPAFNGLELNLHY